MPQTCSKVYKRKFKIAYARMYTDTHACVHVYVCVCVYIYIYIYIYMYMYICMYVCSGSAGKESACNMRETWVQYLGWEDPLEKRKATQSSILAWRIPWTV